MELLQLKYFCDAAKTQNFSKTAKKFFVPTSNISQSIKRLETELDRKLFTRSANKIVLNNTGAQFYKKVSEALCLLESAKNEARSENHSEPIRINIQVNRHITMDAVEKFQKDNPDVSFVISHSIDESAGDFDIVITDKEYDTNCQKTKLRQEPLLIAYNKDIFSPTVQDLEKLPFVSMSSPNSMHYHMNRICNDLGFFPRVVLQSEDPFYIRKCIELGLGVAIVPSLSWSGQFGKNVDFKSVGGYSRTTYIYRKKTENNFVNAFCSMLGECFNSTT